jgi:hypothetical protein
MAGEFLGDVKGGVPGDVGQKGVTTDRMEIEEQQPVGIPPNSL